MIASRFAKSTAVLTTPVTRKQIVGERPVRGLPHERDLVAGTQAHLPRQRPPDEHAAFTGRDARAGEQTSASCLLGDLDAQHDDGKTFLTARGERRCVHARERARDVTSGA